MWLLFPFCNFCFSWPRGTSVSSIFQPIKGENALPFFCTSHPFILILSSYFSMRLLLWTLHLALVPSACLLVASCLWIEQAPRVIGQRRGPGIRADITFFSIGSSQSISKQPELHFLFSMRERVMVVLKKLYSWSRIDASRMSSEAV